MSRCRTRSLILSQENRNSKNQQQEGKEERKQKGECGGKIGKFFRFIQKLETNCQYNKNLQEFGRKIVKSDKRAKTKAVRDDDFWKSWKNRRKSLPISLKWKMCPLKKYLIFLGVWFIMVFTELGKANAAVAKHT